MSRISAWFSAHPDSWIHVASFVRKLIVDLQNDVARLSDEERERVEVSTLHTLARSIVERNHGTQDVPFGPHISMISQEWKAVVWGDTLALADKEDVGLPLREFEHQFHDNELLDESPWDEVREAYFRLCRFYNAIGFADSILHAAQALSENPELVSRDLWIFDEFQDFNRLEEAFIHACTGTTTAILLAGDDDQALYQQLKSSHPEIIRGYYEDPAHCNAMLPYCSRCNFHITKAASSFLAERQEPGSIRKIFLPLEVDEEHKRVQVVACAHPSSVATYIEQFVEDRREAIEARRDAIAAGDAKDPYLLILSFAKDLSYLGQSHALRIEDAVASFRAPSTKPGPDYLRVLLYVRHSRVPTDNFLFRKVLAFENVSEDIVHEAIRAATDQGRSLVQQAGTYGAIQDARSMCAQVTRIVLDVSSSPEEKAETLADLIYIEDAHELAADLAAYPIDEDAEEDESHLVAETSAVELLTMTGSKGLSADHVIIVGCDQLNMAPASPQLFFVAMTRARKSLHLITSMKSGGASRPHEYLDDLPTEHCTFGKFTQQGFADLGDRESYREYFETLARVQRGRR
jgi:superfamily I DNA/RNA helicase